MLRESFLENHTVTAQAEPCPSYLSLSDLPQILAVLLCFSCASSWAPVLGNLEPSGFCIPGIDFPVFNHLDYLHPSTTQVTPGLKSQLRLTDLVIMFSKDMIITFIQGLLMKYLVDISTLFIMDKMKLFLPKTLITYQNHMLMDVLKQVLKLTTESTLKFVMRKISAVTGSQSVRLMKKITYFFKKKNLQEPTCTNMV